MTPNLSESDDARAELEIGLRAPSYIGIGALQREQMTDYRFKRVLDSRRRRFHQLLPTELEMCGSEPRTNTMNLKLDS